MARKLVAGKSNGCSVLASRLVILFFLLLSSAQLNAQSYDLVDSSNTLIGENRFEEALQLLLEAEDKFKANDDRASLARTYKSLGRFYGVRQSYKMAESYLLKALKLFEEQNDTNQIARLYNNLGIINDYNNNFTKALQYHKSSLALLVSNGNQNEIPFSYNNIAECYRALSMYDSALYYYRLGLKLHQNYNSVNEIAGTLNNIGYVHYCQQHWDIALTYYDKSLALANDTKNLYLKRRLNLYISQAWKNLGNTDSALTYYVSYKEINDSIIEAESREEIAEIEAKHALEKALAEKNLIEQQSRVRLLWIGVIGIMVLALASFAFLWQRKRTQLAKVKADSLEEALELGQKLSRDIASDLFHDVGNNLTAIKVFTTGGKIKEADEAIRVTMDEVDAMVERLNLKRDKIQPSYPYLDEKDEDSNG